MDKMITSFFLYFLFYIFHEIISKFTVISESWLLIVRNNFFVISSPSYVLFLLHHIIAFKLYLYVKIK